MIKPEEVVGMVDELAERVIHDGRAIIERDEVERGRRARKSARVAIENAAVAAIDEQIKELSE